VVEFLTGIMKREASLAIWYFNPTSGKTVLAVGYAVMVTSQLLEIETEDEDHMMLLLRATDFFVIDPADAPDELTAICTKTYNYALQFNSEHWQCCILTTRIA
jgi:hypothetical protein